MPRMSSAEIRISAAERRAYSLAYRLEIQAGNSKEVASRSASEAAKRAADHARGEESRSESLRKHIRGE